jgi:transposase
MEKLKRVHDLICPVNVRHKTNIYGVFFMSKFTIEERLLIVQRYLEGNESLHDLANEFNVQNSVVQGWVRLYELQGVQGFYKGYTNYSIEFKLGVLNYMNETGTSSIETAAIFNLPSSGMVRKWRIQFAKGGIDALQPKKKGRPSMKKETKLKKVKKVNPPAEGSLEALREENERLRMENTYLKKLNALVQEKEKLQTKSKRK